MVRCNGNGNVVVNHNVNHNVIDKLCHKRIEFISEGCFYERGSVNNGTLERGSNLQRIGKCVFYWSGVRVIEIPLNVEYLEEFEDHCFSQCGDLRQVRGFETSDI